MARSEGLEPSLKVLETFVLPDKLRTHTERMVGVDPTTNSLENCYYTIELHSHSNSITHLIPVRDF